jgi:hypothetical protein
MEKCVAPASRHPKALTPVRTAMLCSIRKARDLIDLRLFAANADACWREADMASALALPPTATRHLCDAMKLTAAKCGPSSRSTTAAGATT